MNTSAPFDLDAAGGRRFVAELVDAAGVDPAVIDRTGTTLTATEGRSGSNVCVHYSVGQHSLVWCDPALSDQLNGFVSTDVSLGVDEWERELVGRGWTLLGRGAMRTLPQPVAAFPGAPDGLHVRRFDWAADADLASVQALIDVSSEHDLDEAELDIDELDDVAYGVFDEDGAVVAYGSTLPWDMGAGFGDIGVLTRADARGRGLGLVVVGAIIDHLQNDGVDPLYRHDVVNAGSSALANSFGFEICTVVSAASAPV